MNFIYVHPKPIRNNGTNTGNSAVGTQYAAQQGLYTTQTIKCGYDDLITDQFFFFLFFLCDFKLEFTVVEL